MVDPMQRPELFINAEGSNDARTTEPVTPALGVTQSAALSQPPNASTALSRLSPSHRHTSSTPRDALAPPRALSDRPSSFIIPDGVFAMGHMQTVHPALLTVTVRDRNGALHLYAAPIKALNLSGFDDYPRQTRQDGLLLERVASPADPGDYTAVLPLIADGGGARLDFTFYAVPGERYERTAPFHEMRNHVGQPEVTWAGRAQTRRTSGDLRFLTRTDRGPLPQLVSEDDVEALRGQFELRVVIRSIQRPLQVVQPSATPPGRGHPAVLSSPASASSSHQKKRQRASSEPRGRRQDRPYGILHPRTEYVIHLLGETGGRVAQAAILWAAPGSKDEQMRRQKRVKKFLLIDHRRGDGHAMEQTQAGWNLSSWRGVTAASTQDLTWTSAAARYTTPWYPSQQRWWGNQLGESIHINNRLMSVATSHLSTSRLSFPQSHPLTPPLVPPLVNFPRSLANGHLQYSELFRTDVRPSCRFGSIHPRWPVTPIGGAGTGVFHYPIWLRQDSDGGGSAPMRLAPYSASVASVFTRPASSLRRERVDRAPQHLRKDRA